MSRKNWGEGGEQSSVDFLSSANVNKANSSLHERFTRLVPPPEPGGVQFSSAASDGTHTVKGVPTPLAPSHQSPSRAASKRIFPSFDR